MGDPGFLAGLIGWGVGKLLDQVIEEAGKVALCRKNCSELKQMLEPLRLVLADLSSADPEIMTAGVKIWLDSLREWLEEALQLIKKCSVSRLSNPLQRRNLSQRIQRVKDKFELHLKQASMVSLSVLVVHSQHGFSSPPRQLTDTLTNSHHLVSLLDSGESQQGSSSPQPQLTDNREEKLDAATDNMNRAENTGFWKRWHSILKYLAPSRRQFERTRRDFLHNGAVHKFVEFSYEELVAATDNFSRAKRIGVGSFGSVYYGELRGQRLAIKMTRLQCEWMWIAFLSELRVLTRVRHMNLVQLIGYCAEDCLSIVYEYVDNGNLTHHLRLLHHLDVPPLSWSRRLQIALDAARGLEYIHEYTKPTYIHRDVKPGNILIDRNYRAKVSDFGLTLDETTAAGPEGQKMAGTPGYIAPDYFRRGGVSQEHAQKVDVLSFGVVLYQIVSAKRAATRKFGPNPVRVDEDELKVIHQSYYYIYERFDFILNGPNPIGDLKEMIDPGLGTDYPFHSVWKVAKLAQSCTRENPEDRPSMKMVVVALATLCDELDTMRYPGSPSQQTMSHPASSSHQGENNEVLDLPAFDAEWRVFLASRRVHSRQLVRQINTRERYS